MKYSINMYYINLKCSAGKTICSCLSIQEHHSSKHGKNRQNQCPEDTAAPISERSFNAKTLEYHGPTMPYMRIEDPSGVFQNCQHTNNKKGKKRRYNMAGSLLAKDPAFCHL